MPKLEPIKRLLRRWFTSIPCFVLLGLILGFAIAIPVMPKPRIAKITISGTILGQYYVDDIRGAVQHAREDDNIKAVVLQIDSPGGGASDTEQIYLDLLRLRQQKPVVTSVGSIAASGGYYLAVASDFIYAEPTSQIGSVGAWTNLPSPEELDEDVGATGPFKETGRSRQQALGVLEMVRQEFAGAVMSQRGERLLLSEEELSHAQIYVGVEGLRNGLIDDIGTSTDAIEKAASLAGLRNYQLVEIYVAAPIPIIFFGPSDLEDLKSQTATYPIYYYLYFESE